MHNTIVLNEEQAEQLSDLLDLGEEFFIVGRGCSLQLRDPSDHGSWTTLINDTAGE